MNLSRWKTALIFALSLSGVGLGIACGTAPQKNDGPAPRLNNEGGWLEQPQVPASIRVPAGANLLARFHAVGTQIYTCKPSASGTPAWVLKAPAAQLFDAKENRAGTHGEGPSWMSVDGSSVRGKKIAQVDAPPADAIPWLLVQATAHDGAGMFSKVEYVQRVNTNQGKAPAFGCEGEKPDAELSVDYSADYYFYGGVK
jgi:hypothetical protein